MRIDEQIFPVEQLPLDSRLLSGLVKPRCISLTDDQSGRVVTSEIGAAHAVERGSKKDDRKEQRSSEAKGDLNFPTRWKFGRSH
jgi:hypothetical protein